MHLILIRHGQSSNNLLEAAHGCGDLFNSQRCVDPPLSALGETQAALLGTHFGAQLVKSKRRVHLYCSSMTRACQTLQPLARSLELRPVVHPDLYETKGFYGKLSDRGPGRKAIEGRFDGYDASLIPESGQGEETMEEAWRRVQRVASMLRKWAEMSAEDVHIVVSHNDFLGLLGKLLLCPSSCELNAEAMTEPEEMFAHSYWPMNNTGIAHLILGVKPPPSAYPVDTYLLYWNRSDHLTEDVRSGVQFKNVGFGEAAAWARVGQGGSGFKPVFDECAVLRAPRPPLWSRPVCAFATGFVVAGMLAALGRLKM